MSKIYSMSDIHGFLKEFEEALELVLIHLNEENIKLVLLGDYVHGGTEGSKVLDKIMSLQQKYGREKVIAILGNHDEWVMEGTSTIDSMDNNYQVKTSESDEMQIRWLKTLPRYYAEGNTIFVHAGIDEESSDLWEWGTSDEILTMKYPAEKGKILNLEMKVVAGHVSTAEISGDPDFHDIYFDGESHYYIDGSVYYSGEIPVLMVDTDKDLYYRVNKNGKCRILPYKDEYKFER